MGQTVFNKLMVALMRHMILLLVRSNNISHYAVEDSTKHDVLCQQDMEVLQYVITPHQFYDSFIEIKGSIHIKLVEEMCMYCNEITRSLMAYFITKKISCLQLFA